MIVIRIIISIIVVIVIIVIIIVVIIIVVVVVVIIIITRHIFRPLAVVLGARHLISCEVDTIGALIIRIGFWGPLYYNY